MVAHYASWGDPSLAEGGAEGAGGGARWDAGTGGRPGPRQCGGAAGRLSGCRGRPRPCGVGGREWDPTLPCLTRLPNTLHLHLPRQRIITHHVALHNLLTNLLISPFWSLASCPSSQVINLFDKIG